MAAYAQARRLNFDQTVSIKSRSDAENLVFSGGAMADDDIPVSLAWLEHEGRLHLAWEMVVDEKSRVDWYQAWIDAHSGDVLKRVNWPGKPAPRFACHWSIPARGSERCVGS